MDLGSEFTRNGKRNQADGEEDIEDNDSGVDISVKKRKKKLTNCSSKKIKTDDKSVDGEYGNSDSCVSYQPKNNQKRGENA